MNQLEREIKYCEMTALGAEGMAAVINAIATNIELGQGVKADPEIAAHISSYADPYLVSAEQWRLRAEALARGGAL